MTPSDSTLPDGSHWLHLALEAWRSGQNLRSRRKRCKDYTYGRQWDDATTSATTSATRFLNEGQLATEAGYKPMTNNVIRQLVKCVVGNFRASLQTDDTSTHSTPNLPTIATDIEQRCALTELDSRMLEEFLISGCAIQRIVCENRRQGSGIWIDNVSPSQFFVNPYTDPRGLDIELIGMLHSMSLRELLMRFAPHSPERARAIEALYARIEASGSSELLGDATSREFIQAPAGRCRVVEVWTLESQHLTALHHTDQGSLEITGADADHTDHTQEIRQHPITTLRWHCRMLAPDGSVMASHTSPYRHGSHPFAVKLYPLTDGEVHSFVEDIIDQQRHINRLITLIDHIMSVSAKGVLLYPVDSLPRGMTLEQVGRLWAHCNSVIPYTPSRSGAMPQQVVATGGDAGAYRMIDLEMQLIQQITGVSDALQGRIGSGTRHMSAEALDTQARHSAVALLDILGSYNHFRSQRNLLVLGSG